MARKPGETTADVRARKEKNAKAPKFQSGAAPVKALDKPANNPPPSSSSGSSSNSSSSSSSNAAQNFAAGKVNETKNMMNAGNNSASPSSGSMPTGNSSVLPQTQQEGKGFENYKDYFNNYDPASRGGAAFGDEDYNYLQEQGYSKGSIGKYLQELDNSQVSNKYKTRAGQKMNDNPNSPANKARKDGSQYYQGKYSVGYHNDYDQGEDYVSESALGNMRDYFFKKNSGPGQYDFEGGLADWENEGGYAGDVIKWIDSGKSGMDVTDEQYNRLADSSENFDWKRKMNSMARQGSERGTVSASAQYDPRVGGHYTNTYEDTSYHSPDWRPEGYVSANQGYKDKKKDDAWAANPNNPANGGSLSPNAGGAGYRGLSTEGKMGLVGNNYGSNQSDFAPNPNTASVTPVENNYNNYDWEAQMSAAQNKINPYKSNNTPSYSSSMNFNFDPYKFQQGQ